ncbi:hypothetical protein F5884DRAFT_879184 [Xylogone sp. PMI_703]|nr:hypothetical protein F5884DRAFT_879184 [Xylogone sp. PMI_703]
MPKSKMEVEVQETPSSALDKTAVRIPHIAELPQYEREKPYMILHPGEVGIPKSNCVFTEGMRDIWVQNLRAQGGKVQAVDSDGFGGCGFEFIIPAETTDDDDDDKDVYENLLTLDSFIMPASSIASSGPLGVGGDELKKSFLSKELLSYLERTRIFVQKYFRAESVIVIDWRVCLLFIVTLFVLKEMVNDTSICNPVLTEVTLEQVRQSELSVPSTMTTAGRKFEEDTNLERNSPILPAYKAHADLSPTGGLRTLGAHMSQQELQAATDNGSRIRIINFWRPLVDVVEDVPLAMCDQRSVREEDWLLYDRIDRTGPGEGMWLKEREWHRWYWVSKMGRRDAVLFLSWDSEANGFAGHTPHAAFINPNARRNCPPRVSIEVRLIVITCLEGLKNSGEKE